MRWVLGSLFLGGCAAGGHLVISAVPAQPFCTRTLGVAECFADPGALANRPTPVEDTPVRTHVECDPWWRNGGVICALGQVGRD